MRPGGGHTVEPSLLLNPCSCSCSRSRSLRDDAFGSVVDIDAAGLTIAAIVVVLLLLFVVATDGVLYDVNGHP